MNSEKDKELQEMFTESIETSLKNLDDYIKKYKKLIFPKIQRENS